MTFVVVLSYTSNDPFNLLSSNSKSKPAEASSVIYDKLGST
jgi:hypothetical protein